MSRGSLQLVVSFLTGFILALVADWPSPAPLLAEETATLPNTQPLDWQGPLDVRMMDGLYRYMDRRIEQSLEERQKNWRRDVSSPEAYEKSVAPNRQRLKTILGVVDPRLPSAMERFGDDKNPALVAETGRYRIYQVRWPVIEGVTGEGLLLEPKGTVVAQAVAVPDADHTPEQLTGLAPGIAAESQFARRLAEAGLRVVVPTLISRADEWSGHPDVNWTNQPHREWIYRQAYMMGRHVIGYEVQKMLAAVDWLKQVGPDLKIGVAGYGEGGLLAGYAAAVDPRIDACLISGYFDSRQQLWREPLYRNLWGLLREFGDAEIATLIAPRALVVEYSRTPEISGPPPAREGRRGVAAVGEIHTPTLGSVAAEFRRIGSLLPDSFQRRDLIAGADGATVEFGSRQAVAAFVRMLGVGGDLPAMDDAPSDRRAAFSPDERQRRQERELENQVQGLIHKSDRVREQFFTNQAAPDYQKRRHTWNTQQTIPTWPADPFVERAQSFKKYLWEEVFGKLDDAPLPLNPRSRKIYDREKWTGYDVVLDVRPDVFAWGILLVPKDIKPGEKRPVVVCQHGLNGLPANTIGKRSSAYNGASERLVEEGYIVFAPYNPYRGGDTYRILCRKATSVKATLFSIILAQHEQILRWLATLPYVDASRIGFYGLSYGGKTAIRVPPLLDGYYLSICSGDFDDWTQKVASTDNSYSYMFTGEWEIFCFNLGNTFNYAEMAYLMIPRPFMVERGHCDTVAPDEWVSAEYAKVRWMYDMLGLGDRTEIEYFNGGHCFHCAKSFEFLDKHLRGKKDRK